MSGLAALLAHREEGPDPGVFHWRPAFDVADVRRAVEHAGWHFAHLDGAGVASKGELMARIAESFGLPEHFGRNLDALWDALRELDEPLVWLWDAWGPLARAEPDTFAGVLAVLGERTEQGGFAVLLRGDGPQTGLPVLE